MTENIVTITTSDLLSGQYFVVHIVQGRTVSHVESPKQSVSLFLYLLCLETPNICLFVSLVCSWNLDDPK